MYSYKVNNDFTVDILIDGKVWLYQDIDPRNQKSISSISEAENVGAYLVEVETQRSLSMQEVTPVSPPDPEPNITEFILGMMEELKNE